MMKSSLWLFALVVISTFAVGNVLAGSEVKFTPVADDSYVMMCDDAGDVADTGMVLAQMKTERGSSMTTMSPANPTMPAATDKMKAPGPSVQMIEKGGCCAKVGGGCVSWCNKSGGCTGNADCDTFKAN